MGEQGQDFSKSHFLVPPIGDILTNCNASLFCGFVICAKMSCFLVMQFAMTILSFDSQCGLVNLPYKEWQVVAASLQGAPGPQTQNAFLGP